MTSTAKAVVTLSMNMGVAAGTATALGTALGTIAPFALIAGVIGLVKLIDTLNVSMSEYQKQVNDSYDKSQNNINRIKELSAEYEGLAKKTSLTKDEKLKLIDIEHELNTKFGKTTDAIDLQNDSLDTNIQKIDSLTQKEAERFQLLNKRAYESANRLLDKNNSYSVGNGQAGMMFQNIEAAIAHYEELVKNSTNETNVVYEFRKKILEELYTKYDAAKDIVTKYNGYETLLNGTIKQNTEETNKNIESINQVTSY
jgi:hypothetical protein